MGRRQRRAGPSEQPEQIGRYPIVGELGRGGMGVVYMGRDPTLDRPVAIKILPAALSIDEDRTAGFIREAKILAALNHPNIATIHSLEEADGRVFLILELIEGPTLEERLVREGMATAEALSIGAQIARALEAAHERGVVHRDLKPANIKITPGGLVKVLDFGIATMALAGGPEQAKGEQQGVIGTPGYMSPEQFDGKSVDHLSDVWAFGCVLYECLTGVRAFEGRNLFETMFRTMERDPDWSALPHDLPEALTSLLERCLAKQPAHRPESVAEVRLQIDELLVSRAGPVSWHRPASAAVVDDPGRAHNLPNRLTTFIGREQHLDEIEELIGRHRLVTLIGAGGSGKTRLALETAGRMLERFPGGVWLIDLAPLREGAALVPAVAAALDVKEQRGKTARESLFAYLAGRQLLLILDNCEHLLEVCSDLVDELLRADAAPRMLATSRETLGVEGEQVYSVPPLQVSTSNQPDTDELLQTEATRLFIDRAAAALHGFTLTPERCAAIAHICRRLDGIPLAIEIAAAMVKALPVEEINARLEQSLRVLTRGSKTAPPRHRTVRATIDWSHELLTELERVVFRRLAVFAGGWTLDAAEQVCAGEPIEKWDVLDLFTRLVDKSLVEMDTAKSDQARRGRYRMLETVREYAVERLEESGEADRVRSRYRNYFLDLAHQAAAHKMDAAQIDWLSRLDHEHDNMRAVLAALVEADDPEQCGLILAGSLGWFWEVRGLWTEGRDALNALLDKPSAILRTRARSLALAAAGELARVAGEFDRARALFERSLDASEGDADRGLRGVVLGYLGNLDRAQGRIDEARVHLESALDIHRAAGNRPHEGVVLGNLGDLHRQQGHMNEAREHYETALAIHREVGNRLSEAAVLGNLGTLHALEGRAEEARQHYEMALRIHRESGDRRLEGSVLGNLGILLARQGRIEEAREQYEAALTIHRGLGNRRLEGIWLGNLGILHHRQGRIDEAHARYQAALAIHRELGDRRGTGNMLGNLGNLHHEQGKLEEAREYYDGAIAVHREVGDRPSEGVVLGNLGTLHHDQGRFAEARELYESALAIHREVGNRPLEGVVLGNLGLLDADEGRFDPAHERYRMALTIAREVGDRSREGVVLGNLANLDVEQDRTEDARGRYASALAIHREVGNRRFEGGLLADLARLHSGQGRTEEARLCFDRSVAILRDVGERIGLGEALCKLALHELGLDELAAARAALTEAEAIAHELHVTEHSRLGRMIAELHRSLGRADRPGGP
ncbi:MAG: tetratricopeptide repeat protein [Candidatus Eiseniibacteriota bacterium]|jgi:non-specific serine/threonine protein kinase